MLDKIRAELDRVEQNIERTPEHKHHHGARNPAANARKILDDPLGNLDLDRFARDSCLEQAAHHFTKRQMYREAEFLITLDKVRKLLCG